MDQKNDLNALIISHLSWPRASWRFSVTLPAQMSPLSSWALRASYFCTWSKTSTSASRRNFPFPFLERLLWSLCRLASRLACPYRRTTRWTWLGRYQQGWLFCAHFIRVVNDRSFMFCDGMYSKCYLMYCQAPPSYPPTVLLVTQLGHRFICCSNCGILNGHLALQNFCPEAWL